MTALADYINSLKADEMTAEYDVKYIRARDLVANLPEPSNLRRDLSLIPNFDVKLLLSNTGIQPKFIRERIAGSKQNGLFKPDTLMGLCYSGLSALPEIFLNAGLMKKIDPSGILFDEITWHEYLHGAEGIIEPGKREIPWSFGLQQDMIRTDEEEGHVSFIDKSMTAEFNTQVSYIRYLREGTELQDNVSEIFARVGVLFYNSITNTGSAPTPKDMSIFNPGEDGMAWHIGDREQYNRTDLWAALSTFSDKAIDKFVDKLPEALSRVTALYGCQPTG